MDRDLKKLVSIFLEPEKARYYLKSFKLLNIYFLKISSAFNKSIKNLVKISNNY